MWPELTEQQSLEIKFLKFYKKNNTLNPNLGWWHTNLMRYARRWARTCRAAVDGRPGGVAHPVLLFPGRSLPSVRTQVPPLYAGRWRRPSRLPGHASSLQIQWESVAVSGAAPWCWCLPPHYLSTRQRQLNPVGLGSCDLLRVAGGGGTSCYPKIRPTAAR